MITSSQDFHSFWVLKVSFTISDHGTEILYISKIIIVIETDFYFGGAMLNELKRFSRGYKCQDF